MQTVLRKPMDEGTGITGWVLAAITTIGGILSGVIAMLYKTQIADYKLMIAELKAKVETLTHAKRRMGSYEYSTLC